MRLYLIRRTDNFSYDEYDSAVVAAKSKKDASTIHPEEDARYRDYGWTTLDNIEVKYIGRAKRRTKRGVICASYNAG